MKKKTRKDIYFTYTDAKNLPWSNLILCAATFKYLSTCVSHVTLEKGRDSKNSLNVK